MQSAPTRRRMLGLLAQAEACLWQMRGVESLTATCWPKPGRDGVTQRPFQRARAQGNGNFLKAKKPAIGMRTCKAVWEALAERERGWM